MDGLVLKNMLEELRPLFERYASKDNIITEENVHKLENPHIRSIFGICRTEALIGRLKTIPRSTYHRIFKCNQSRKEGNYPFRTLQQPRFTDLLIFNGTNRGCGKRTCPSLYRNGRDEAYRRRSADSSSYRRV